MLSNDANGAMVLKKERNQLEERGLKHVSACTLRTTGIAVASYSVYMSTLCNKNKRSMSH